MGECAGDIIMDSVLEREIGEPSSHSSQVSLHSLSGKYPWEGHESIDGLNSKTDWVLPLWLVTSLGGGQY